MESPFAISPPSAKPGALLYGSRGRSPKPPVKANQLALPGALGERPREP